MTDSDQTPELAAAEKALLAELAADSKTPAPISELSFPEYMAEVQQKLLTASETAVGYRNALTEEWGDSVALQLATHALSTWQSYILRNLI